MNILFIEDEKDLARTGVEQLELRGYKVFLAHSISEAQAILEDPDKVVHYIITDHLLEDGKGIEFVRGLKGIFPLSKCAVVSGYLTGENMHQLKEDGVLYYQKPLLYTKVIDELRRIHVQKTPLRAPDSSDSLMEETTPETPKKGRRFISWLFG